MSATVTYQYVYFGSSGRHTRQPRVINSTGGFFPLNLSGGTETLVPGTTFQVSPAALPASALIPGGTSTCNFSFVSVSGLTEGPLTSTDMQNPPHGTVGSSPITVLVVYLPVGGGKPGPPPYPSGAIIDAFDESTGSLINDTFITANPDGGETNDGNVNGYVDTTSKAEAITAYTHVTPTNANFVKWVNLGNPTAAITGSVLHVAEQQTIYALAFYKNPVIKSVKEGIKEIKEIKELKEINKEYKDTKDHVKEHQKELLKDTLKEHTKDAIFEVNNPKPTGKDKEEEGPNFGNVGDPSQISNQLQKLSQAVTDLHATIQNQGQAFIKAEDRPPVGKTVAKGGQ